MIKNKSAIDLDAQLEASNSSSLSIRVSGVILGLFIAVIGITLENEIFRDGLICGGITCVILFGFFFKKILKKSLSKMMKKKQIYNQEISNHYEFEDESFKVKTLRNEEEYSNAILKYSDLVKVLETTNYFLLFIALGQALVVYKPGTYEGSNEDLSKILKEKAKNYKKTK